MRLITRDETKLLVSKVNELTRVENEINSITKKVAKLRDNQLTLQSRCDNLREDIRKLKSKLDL